MLGGVAVGDMGRGNGQLDLVGPGVVNGDGSVDGAVGEADLVEGDGGPRWVVDCRFGRDDLGEWCRSRVPGDRDVGEDELGVDPILVEVGGSGAVESQVERHGSGMEPAGEHECARTGLPGWDADPPLPFW